MSRLSETLLYKETDEYQFKQFLRQLVAAEYLKGAALGITALVINQGQEVLTRSQEYVFQKEVMDTCVRSTCVSCGEKIPWCNMFFAIDRGECADCDPRLKSHND